LSRKVCRCAKKNARDRLICWCSQQPSWAIGFLDEVWWSRFALPSLNAWQSKDEPVRLVEQVWQKHDPDPKAFACYGVLWQHRPATSPLRRQMSLRFVDGRPVSAITTQFLEWICTNLQAGGKTGFQLIWDNASWHYSKQAKKGVRILPFFLPTKSPWLNPIEPKWVHARKAVVEPNGRLSAKELAERICAHFGCSYEPPLAIVEEVS
jgi:transposase